MPAPEISVFGDGDHQIGESGLTIDGGGLGAFPGSAWVYQNSNRSGASDELVIGTWNDIELSGVDIPGSALHIKDIKPGADTESLCQVDRGYQRAFKFVLVLKFGN